MAKKVQDSNINRNTKSNDAALKAFKRGIVGKVFSVPDKVKNAKTIADMVVQVNKQRRG